MNRYYRDETDKRPVLIFGTGDLSELACYWLMHDSPYTPAAFVVEAAFLTQAKSHFGLPVFTLEELHHHYTPAQARFLVPIGYRAINGARKRTYLQIKALGFEFVRYMSSQSSIWNIDAIGENTLVYEHAIIQPFATVGANCIIRSGAHISHHCRVNNHAFIAAEVAMGGRAEIGEQAFVGIGATIADSVSIANSCFIGAGAVVVKSTQPELVYVGNPAKASGKMALEVTGG